MAQDINHYLAATSPENVSNGLSGPQETHYVNTGMSDVYGLLVLASIGASAYHGFKRNDSVGWGIVWGLLGGIAPVITPAIAVAQGFGEPERHGNPTKEEEEAHQRRREALLESGYEEDEHGRRCVAHKDCAANPRLGRLCYARSWRTYSPKRNPISHAKGEAAVDAAVSRFPASFKLRSHGGTFRVSRRASYFGDSGQVVLYTQRLGADGVWRDFAKGSESELRREIVKGNPTEESWWAAHDGNQVYGIGQTEKLALDDAFHGRSAYVRIRGAPSGLKVDQITEDQMVMAYYDSHWPIKVPSASDNAEQIALRRQRGELVENYYEYCERTRRERERLERERRGR